MNIHRVSRSALGAVHHHMLRQKFLREDITMVQERMYGYVIISFVIYCDNFKVLNLSTQAPIEVSHLTLLLLESRCCFVRVGVRSIAIRWADNAATTFGSNLREIQNTIFYVCRYKMYKFI